MFFIDTNKLEFLFYMIWYVTTVVINSSLCIYLQLKAPATSLIRGIT